MIELVNNPIRSCFKYIEDNFDSIYPFELNCGYRFQIRMNKQTYSELSDKYKDELKKFADPDAYKGSDPSLDDIIKRYKIDFYWINTEEYIFNFRLKRALCLSTNCEWDYMGITDCKDVVFINENELSKFILLNIGLNSNQKPKYYSIRNVQNL